MKERKYIFLVCATPALAIAIFWIGQYYRQEYSRIPDKRMWIAGRDVKNGNLVKWPHKGTATIISPEFLIAFEGISWSEMSLIRSQYKIDGRYGGLNSPDSQPWVDDMGNGVKYEYSARQRTATIKFGKHTFIYCDYLKKLTADGVNYSTSGETIYLWVSKSGKIKLLS